MYNNCDKTCQKFKKNLNGCYSIIRTFVAGKSYTTSSR